MAPQVAFGEKRIHGTTSICGIFYWGICSSVLNIVLRNIE